MGPFYCKKRLPNSVQRTSTSFKSTHLSSPVSKTRTGRRGQQSPPKEGSGGNNSGISRILFKKISGSKEKRKTQIDYRSFNSESLCSYSKFQNGGSEKGQKLHSSQRLGIFVRSDGCLFACPYSSNVSQISSLHSKQQDISIQSSPIRVVNQSFCIHSTNDGNSFTSTHQSYFPLSLSRRLAVKEPKSSSSVTTQTIYHPPDLSFRPYNKSGQIRSNSITGLCFHRDGISHPTKCSENSKRQSSSITSVDNFFPSTKDSYCQTVPISSGKTQCSSRLCRTRQASPSTSANVSVSSVETSQITSFSSYQDLSQYLPSSYLVEQSSYLQSRSSNQNTLSFSPVVHRCQSIRLGSSSGTRRNSVSWSMDTRSISTPYQSFGNDGNISCFEAITPSHLTINSTSVLRQHNCNLIPFSSGRDSFPKSLSRSMELTQLVSSKQDQTHNQTHSREIQHSGRSIIQNKQTDFHRMVSQSKNCQCNFSHDQFSQHRSFCNTSQSQTSSLCVSYPRRKSSCNRCIHDELESHSRLCLSSISSDTECFEQNPSISMQNCSCSSSVAKQILVPRTTKSASVSTNMSSSLSRPSGTVTRKISTSKHSTSCPSRLGIIKQSIRNKKFSREVADHVSKARRASTRQVYDSRWKIFTNWASKRKINPSKATPDIIADFLIYLFKDKNCQVSTIKGYRSMISNTLKFSSNLDIGNDPVLSELIKSFNMQRPVNRPLAPKWDLAFVLSCLCKEPYEPLSTASLIHLSMKTAFLLTMATARRVSEIHAFSIDKEHLRFSSVDGSLTLRTQVGFLAKNQLPFKAPDSIFIPRLPKSHKSNNFNRLLCPVRAVKIYLKRTKSIRGNRTRLFIPTKGNHDINKSTISSWVKFTIKKAYKSISNRHIPLFKPRAHELRALSASWAYFNFIPLDEVIKAAVWSSSSTFAKFYLRDFQVQQANLRDLGSLVVAQKVVRGTDVPVPAHEEL